MVTHRWSRIIPCVVLAIGGCTLPQAPTTTGGVHLDAGASDGAAGTTDAQGDDGSPPRVCPAGLVVGSSDFASTNISALSASGAVLSESLISSASAPLGLTTALSGDIVLPLTPVLGKIVLIDRYPNSVLTWLDPGTAKVSNQLAIGTGFAANPHDYVEISATKAYVTRYESNSHAGQQAFDGGGDLLVVDPLAATITGRIPFGSDGAFLPRPGRMARVGNEVWVSLERFDADFKTAGDARVVGISTADDSVGWTLDLAGVASCGVLAIAPSGHVVALSCSGVLGDPNRKQRSAIVLIDATVHPPVELERFAVAAQLGAPLGSALSYASEGLLVGVALGDTLAKRNDVAYTLDIASGMATVLVDAGAAFALGDVRCSPGCEDRCFLADAQAKALRVWSVHGSLLEAQPSITVDPVVGLPPRVIGQF